MKNPIIGLIIVAILFGAGGFFGGMQYQKSQRTSLFMGGGAGARRIGQNGNQNITSVRGQILSSDANSITIKLPDGSSKIVMLGGNTSVMEATSASKDSLKSGQTVAVFGSTNPDGSVTAQNIQLNPPQGGQGVRTFGGNGG